MIATSNRLYLLAGLVSLAALFVPGCGGAPALLPGDDAGQTAPQDSGVGSTLQTATALSKHYVEVIFDEVVGPEAENPANYTITGPNSSALTVTASRIVDDGHRVILTTSEQQEVEYRLTITGEDSEAQKTAKLAMNQAQVFKGSSQSEPYVASAIALDPNHVLVTYDVVMDNNTAVVEYYEIASPDLQVTDAVPGSTKTTVLLTTSSQENIDYHVRATNVTAGNGTKLIDPTRSTVSFNGIAPNEPPELTAAAATSSTTVLVSFNKPLADDAADPTHFSISPDLVVISTEMSLYNTQIRLVTPPMTAGQSYVLTVTGIKDRGGNLIGANNQATFTFSGAPDTGELVGPLALPRVVGAASLSNTSVVITFNKPMGDSALFPSNYVIVQENVNPEAGTLLINGAAALKFTDSSRTAVLISTAHQNEVTYRIKAVNVKDLSGNGLAPQTLLVDPTSATFVGTPPSGGDIFDSDEDGILDNLEMRGYVVTVVGSDGESEQIQVTSDPFLKDTDLDGLEDLVEKMIRTDPRNPDTDGDGLSDYDEYNVYFSSPSHQDTDDDGLDDNLEVMFFKTSPLFDDTDGDGLKDGDEINAGNRNPLVADLPEPGILIGEVALRLDTRFQYTDTEGNSQSIGKSTQATLAQSQEKKFAQSDTETTKHEVEGGFELGYSSKDGASAKLSAKYTFARENAFTASAESTAGTQKEYQNSLSTNVQRDITKEVTRTVEGASIDLVVTLGNFSDIPFTMDNIEVTALMQDPYNRQRLTPVASLLPASMLTSGDFEVYLGPFIQERGPFIFKSTDVFPSLVEDLMKNPRGLIFKVANFDITDEQGRNFAYISQEVNDRTAGIIIDYGNGEVEKYRVATSSTFDEKGKPKGITMKYALQEILGMSESTEADLQQNAITVGPNGCAETFAVGDDVQVVWPVCLPVAPGGSIVRPGANGVLDTLPSGDDVKVRLPDGSFEIHEPATGGDGCASSRAQRDDVQVVASECATGGLDGIVILAGENGVIDTTPAGDDELTAVSGYGTAMIGQCDGHTINAKKIVEPSSGGNGIANTKALADDIQVVAVGEVVQPGGDIVTAGLDGILQTRPLGDDILLGPGCLCSQDSECPGGGACRKIQRLVRVKSVKDKPAEARFWVTIGPPDMQIGTDFDKLPLKAGNVYTLAYVQDQDMDGLYAREEYLYGSSDRRVNSDGCPLGDGAEGCDPARYDFDSLRDLEEVRTGWRVQVTGQSGYVAYTNPVQPDSDADKLFDDEERAMGTDGGKRDTDDDGISDFDEVRGYQIVRRDGALIRKVPPYQSAVVAPGRDGVLQTTVVAECSDTIVDHCDVCGQDELGRNIITPGPDGIIDSVLCGDDVLEGTAVILDGGNGIPETVVSGDDIQVGAAPTMKRTVTLTVLDYEPGNVSCDPDDVLNGARTRNPGEFVFGLLASKGADNIVGELAAAAVIDPSDTYVFGPHIVAGTNATFESTLAGDDVKRSINGHEVILPGPNGTLDTLRAGDDQSVGTSFIGPGSDGSLESTPVGDDVKVSVNGRDVILPGANGTLDTTAAGSDQRVNGPVFSFDVELTDTITLSAKVIEDDPVCSDNTRSAVIEPLVNGNGLADTLTAMGSIFGMPVPLDDQVLALGAAATPGEIVISSCRPIPLIDPDASLDSTPAVPGLCKPYMTAGPNGIANTAATADDEQLVAVGTTGLDPKKNIIGPGLNGLIDTTPAGDDVLLLPHGPVPPVPCEPFIAEPANGDGKVRTKLEAGSDDVYASGITYGGTVTPGQVIVLPGPDGQIQSLPARDEPAIVEPTAGDGKANTTACRDGTGAEIEGCDDVQEKQPATNVAAGAVIISAGADGILQTVQSGDDKPAIIEPLTGGNGYADTTAALFDVQLKDPGVAVDPGTIIVGAGPNSELDTFVSASAEVLVRTVPLDGLASSCPSGKQLATIDCTACPAEECYGDDVLFPKAAGDTCEQAWFPTSSENDLTCPCGACRSFGSAQNPTTPETWLPELVTIPVSDLKGVSPEGLVVTLADGEGCFSSAKLHVLIQINPGAFVQPGAVLVRAGPNGKLDTTPSGDDAVGVPHLTLYASNPLDRDTDADGLFDGAEQVLGSNPNDALDAQRYRDNDLDGLPNGVELNGWVLGYTDENGVLQCLTKSGVMSVPDEFNPPAACLKVTSDPFEPDTDFDGLPDLLEYLIHSDPRSPDTDDDGLLDYDEFDPKSRFSIPTLTLREFQRRCAEAPRCSFTPAETPSGTSVALADTDRDGLTDRDEVEGFWIIAPCVTDSTTGAQNPGLPRKVFSSPLTADFDLDGVLDGRERTLLLDPLNPDTDGDGKPDGNDGSPDGCGKSITVTLTSYDVDDNCEPKISGDGEFHFRLKLQPPNGLPEVNWNQDFDLGDNASHTFPSTSTTTFSMRAGNTFTISGSIWEADPASDDERWTISARTFDYNVAPGETTIGPIAGVESYSGCYGNHLIKLQIAVGQD